MNFNSLMKCLRSSEEQKIIREEKCTGIMEVPRVFTFRDLAVVTQNFSQQSLIGEGGTAKVYKGYLETGQLAQRGTKEFDAEANLLTTLRHPNIVTLIGHCVEGEEMLLVYEFMELGSLVDHLHDFRPSTTVLSWRTRVEVAVGIAKGLAYLHDSINHHQVIHRDLKSSNILLDANFIPKISDFGISKLGPVGEDTHVSTEVKGTCGFLDPEYVLSGQLTVKADIYSFGIILWELIAGRKAIEPDQSSGKQNILQWAQPYYNNNSEEHRKLVDPTHPRLKGKYSKKNMEKAISLAAMCTDRNAPSRPPMNEVVDGLTEILVEAMTWGNRRCF
ncbi:probable serine/threonine-protein kinase PBL7 [Rosa rugosa]|uniref:probable serine/threonine-protein kinase PBL7 n=1 Tax=Rosa rugosa TaxID=74645 RepID=UPI002B40E5C7|nr:probable serine/threonine-protein kinase PBL7 [Rosa rugosa]